MSAAKNTRNFGKVAVLFGGRSAEREVSLMSGTAVLRALQSRGVNAHAFDPAVQPLSDLKTEGFDRVFIALHGRWGEDGTVQGALELMDIPYTGSGVMASALAMDKWRTKMIWIVNNIPTPKYRVVDAHTDWAQLVVDLGFPQIFKPAHEGSSIGITKVETAANDALAKAYAAAARHEALVISEEFISGQELTVAILGEGDALRALPLIRIEAPGGNYDYQSKYFSEATKYHCPSGLAPALEKHIQDVCLDAFRLIGCRGWGRIDVMLDANDNPYLLEVNTSPGMTSHSLVPMAARAAGISFEDLVLEILETAKVDEHVE